MVEVPTATPVTRPLEFTVAFAGVLEVQTTAWLAAAGRTEESMLVTLPTATVAVAGVVTTDVTAIGVSSTITLAKPPGRDVALAVME
jgi:hypothetical protein